MNNDKILCDVERYYSKKVTEKGATPQGVDWNSEESQNIRFEQLLKIAESVPNSSLLDYGCGYAALLDYLDENKFLMRYTGYDISDAMLTEVRNRHPELGPDAIVQNPGHLGMYDYVVASGIFNVRLDNSEAKWRNYVFDTIHTLAEHSKKGFAFNVLTSYSDPEYMREDLYYADPCLLFDHCKKKYSKSVALLHDYGLYEFTMLVRKSEDELWLS